MELKEYQKQVIKRLSGYLVALNQFKEKYNKALEADPDLAEGYHFPEKAWLEIGLSNYNQFKNGLSEPLPNVFFKVPTGGGKTLLAAHAIDLVNKVYLKKQNGMVLWIVPTSQIYNQTLEALNNRNHPYRQLLDISSGGKTLIYEKLDHFNPQDIENNLCIMLLMLPSASRRSKETLKVFKDNSGYASFFPAEDDYKGQHQLLEKFPNLDTYGDSGEMFGELPLSSMGNTLRLLKPIIIIDEGHKAYSQTARDTIYNFNPSFVLELSATPPDGVNELVQITGKQLNDEEMIKLDIHLTNKATSGWKDTISEAKAFRDELENKAKEYEQNTSKYIRPIMLIQVERTGKDQRDGVQIHSEDVREFLIKQCAVPADHIAVKTSDKDEIENIDLLTQECPIRYIITKHALQEGWDCPFAYVLATLTNSQSETAMTQLIGRVLRQPYAVKTNVKELDECYVYTCQYDTAKLVRGIKKNLEGEGLGDIAGRLSIQNGSDSDYDALPEKSTTYRDEFKKFVGKIFLPIFAVSDNEQWREVSYSADILSRIEWSKVDLSRFDTLSLEEDQHDDVLVQIGFRRGDSISGEEHDRLSFKSEIDYDYIARQLIDVIPNPWVSFDLGKEAVTRLLKRYDQEVVAHNLVFAIEELKKVLFEQRDALSEQVFRKLLKDGELRFFLIKGNYSTKNPSLLPKSITVRSKKPLFNYNYNQPLQRSLFDYIPDEDMNDLEKEVALYLDGQQQLLWWYRNMSKAQYRIQGWKPHRIYPDFVATRKSKDNYDKVYVLESKGEHLEYSEDSSYKRAVLDLCNDLAVESDVAELDLGFTDPEFEFQMVDQRKWRAQLNDILQ